jgi:hypothetical protein
VWRRTIGHGALYQMAPTIGRRWPLVGYIRRKHPTFFRLGIVDEVMVMADGEEVALPAQIGDGELLTKEEWLVNVVKGELSRNRKVIIYPQQTSA